MRFEVPQFIEIEDKIIGPLTWKQFVYLAGGAGILIILYLTLPFVFFAVFGLPLGALAASLAFHRINNRPFSAFLESFVSYFTKTKLYLWRKEQTPVPTEEMPTKADVPNVAFTNKSSINSLSRRLELHLPEQQS
jgi:hypothetical protein